MLDATLDLGRAPLFVGTEPGRLALNAFQRRATLGTVAYEAHLLAHQQAGRGVDRGNLGYDFAPLLDIDHVAYVQVEGVHEIFVVQGGPLDNRAREQHRVEVGHRGDGARAPYLERHRVEPRERLLGLELVGDGPTGRLGRVAQVFLLPQRVDLEDHAVGSHRQMLALGVPIGDILLHLVDRVENAHGIGYLETPRTGPLQVLVVGIGGQILTQQVIEVGIEPPGSHYGRVLRFEGAGRRVAGVGKEGLLLLLALLVERLEDRPGHEYLAPNLKRVGVVVAPQLQGNAANGLHILGHIIAPGTVAPGHGLHQPSVLVDERDGGTVEFQFAHQLELLAHQPRAHPVVEGGHLFNRIGVAQRQHGVTVLDLRKGPVDVVAHPLRGRVGVEILGVGLFETLQFVHHLVEGAVVDGRGIQHIVVVVVLIELFAQSRYLFLGRFHVSKSVFEGYGHSGRSRRPTTEKAGLPPGPRPALSGRYALQI